MSSQTIRPGAFHLPGYLSLDLQRKLADECRALLDGAVPGYIPVLRSGAKMRLRMLCLGRHWNPRTYRYESNRSDFDGLPAPPLPDHWKALARGIAASVGMSLDPDLCIINAYDGGGRLGLHQDKDESKQSIAAGVPVVSLSIGDTAQFAFGGLRRDDETTIIPLESGDAFVFGGPARLCYHGVTRVVRGTAPRELQLTGRFNLTFRQFDVAAPVVNSQSPTPCQLVLQFTDVDFRETEGPDLVEMTEAIAGFFADGRNFAHLDVEQLRNLCAAFFLLDYWFNLFMVPRANTLKPPRR